LRLLRSPHPPPSATYLGVGEANISLQQVKDFDDPDNLWADLQNGAPNLVEGIENSPA
jgi:hypothetical protein